MSMPRGRSIIALVSATAAFLGGAVAVSAAHEPDARAAANCGVGSGRSLGYTYVTSLTVRGTSCSTGKNLAKHHGHVSGWSCKNKRLATNPVQYQGRETCTSGSRRVVWTYSQNT
jgi:hypothetical protein